MFQFKKYNEYRGAWEDAGFLLMPGEVKEFHTMIERGLSFDYAFTRLTGKAMSELQGIKLVVEYHPEVSHE
jgi:hypothetical protein